jgi:hypothetical protein
LQPWENNEYFGSAAAPSFQNASSAPTECSRSALMRHALCFVPLDELSRHLLNVNARKLVAHAVELRDG